MHFRSIALVSLLAVTASLGCSAQDSFQAQHDALLQRASASQHAWPGATTAPTPTARAAPVGVTPVERRDGFVGVRAAAMSGFIDRQTRVWAVGSRLRVVGAELCDDVRYTFGFFAIDRNTFSIDDRALADDFGLGPGVRIWRVREEFAEASARLRRGDEIVAIDGKSVHDFRSFEKAMRKPFKHGEMSMMIVDDSGAVQEMSLRGELACDFRVGLIEGYSVNAYADGKNVFITEGMLRTAHSDDDLAVILGHALAHNELGHPLRKRVQGAAGLLFDVATFVFTGVYTGGAFHNLAKVAFAGGMEEDADYMGLYLAAGAGYDVSGAPQLWDRMIAADADGANDGVLTAHPTTLDRATALGRTIREIKAKQTDVDAASPEDSES